MLILKYLNTKTTYEVNFLTISENIVEVTGNFPIKTKGFTLSRPTYEDNWDYSGYTTIYREIENGVQFSNNGSVYIAPDPVPELPDIPTESYEPTLQEIQENKINEMRTAQQQAIQNGINVTLKNGTNEHFTLSDQDQTSLMGLQTQVAQGLDNIPWHTSDQTQHCKYYSNADMALIVSTAMQYVTYHVTYYRDLRIYIRSSEIDDVRNIYYGMPIPIEFQSEPLKDMLAAQNS